MTRQDSIREIARRLLAEGKVDMVLGYAKGPVPLRDRPLFARTPEEADRLVWTGFCTSNLATLLPQGSARVAVVAQGCVSRNLVQKLRENQLSREQVYVIGVPCLGMLDRRKLEARLAGKVITGAVEDGEEVEVTGQGFSQRMKRGDVLRDNCVTCRHRNPVISDELAAEPVEDRGPGDIDKVAAPWEKLSPAERRERFAETFKECIRCYACRDACPLCYCKQCFVDESRPQWVGKTVDPADVASFHLLRAFHCAGRCSDCGACESACPQGIKMRRLTQKLEKDIRALYGFEPGLEVEAMPPLAVFTAEDPDEFK